MDREAAQKARLIRPDITTSDISLIIRLITIPMTGPDGEARGERVLDLLLYGALLSGAAA